MQILGIDVGGSGIKGAVVKTKSGKLATERYRISTPQPADPESVTQVIRQIVEFFKWQGIIGCGFPAAVLNGVVQTASNISKSWIGINIEEHFKQAVNSDVKVVNDADAAGIAEMRYGAGRGQKGVVVIITIGTGIGTSLFTKGKLLPNSELGHIYLKNLIAEKYTSDAIRKDLDLSWKDWAIRFNEYLKHIESLFYPEMIIIGGGASKKHNQFFQYLEVNARVVPARLSNHAGIIGAARYAEKNLRITSDRL
jgi:polyphosphate glucokinase